MNNFEINETYYLANGQECVLQSIANDKYLVHKCYVCDSYDDYDCDPIIIDYNNISMVDQIFAEPPTAKYDEQIGELNEIIEQKNIESGKQTQTIKELGNKIRKLREESIEQDKHIVSLDIFDTNKRLAFFFTNQFNPLIIDNPKEDIKVWDYVELSIIKRANGIFKHLLIEKEKSSTWSEKIVNAGINAILLDPSDDQIKEKLDDTAVEFIDRNFYSFESNLISIDDKYLSENLIIKKRKSRLDRVNEKIVDYESKIQRNEKEIQELKLRIAEENQIISELKGKENE